MDMTGERQIPASRERVWAALNDPATLKASIPGCESLTKESDTEMQAVVGVTIGSIFARFHGRLRLSDLDPPRALIINGDGQGGTAGYAQGAARVRLDTAAGATNLVYTVQANGGGKIAQLGAALTGASAKLLADQFLDNFTRQISLGPADAPAAPLASETKPIPEHAAAPARISVFSAIPAELYGFPIVAWIGGFLWLLVLILITGIV